MGHDSIDVISVETRWCDERRKQQEEIVRTKVKLIVTILWISTENTSTVDNTFAAV